MREGLITSRKYENLETEIYSTRSQMGKAAAIDISRKIQALLKTKDSIRIIFAAAPSQNEMLSELIKDENIDWSKITAFHMDEYVGLSNTAPQAFGQFLRDRLFDKVQFGKVNYINSGEKRAEITCGEYEQLLREEPIDIVCMGIGENGHIAFNDPPYANFKDTDWVKIVELDNVSRQQQVNDGCFKTIQDVPAKAITLTIPALLSAESLFVVVPGKTKANAVKRTLHGPIVQDCPASILRNQKNAKLYLDNDSAVLLNS